MSINLGSIKEKLQYLLKREVLTGAVIGIAITMMLVVLYGGFSFETHTFLGRVHSTNFDMSLVLNICLTIVTLAGVITAYVSFKVTAKNQEWEIRKDSLMKPLALAQTFCLKITRVTTNVEVFYTEPKDLKEIEEIEKDVIELIDLRYSIILCIDSFCSLYPGNLQNELLELQRLLLNFPYGKIGETPIEEVKQSLAWDNYVGLKLGYLLSLEISSLTVDGSIGTLLRKPKKPESPPPKKNLTKI